MPKRSRVASIACTIGLLALAVACTSLRPARNRPISLSVTGSPPILLIQTSRRTSKACTEIAPSDIATAIKFCRTASAIVAPCDVSARARLRRQQASARTPSAPIARQPTRAARRPWSSSACMLAHRSGRRPGRSAQARKLFERAAAAGNPRGVTNLAALSEPARQRTVGSRQVQSHAHARRRRRIPAEAQYQLGLMFADGVGGPQDDVAARAACSRRLPRRIIPAPWSGWAHSRKSGRGGPQDSTAAKAYYERAAALGNEDAKAALERAQMPLRDQGQARQTS